METEDDLDRRYMRLACRLALKGAGRTSPNPMVGAVLVRGRRVVATGYHKFAGGDHAEIVALKRAGSKARGTTLYLNLEPCSHHGRTPPCADSLIRAGVSEVVVGMKDPNPIVAGRGIRRLRGARIRVRIGILEEECRALNEAFAKYITRKMSFVTLKLAATLDGKIATASGDSRWVTGATSRNYVHRLRDRIDALMVGVGTVVADDPQLNCRFRGGRNPFRVILDPRLRIPLSARLLRAPDREKNIVVTSTRAAKRKVHALEALGADVWILPQRNGRIPWSPLLRRLASNEIVSVMIEGGAATARWALMDRAVDKAVIFYAPKFVGGDGKVMIETLGIKRMRRAMKLQRVKMDRLGADFLVSGYF